MRRFVLAFDSFNDEGIEKFRFFLIFVFKKFQFFVLKSDFIIKRLIELSFVLLIFWKRKFPIRGFGAENFYREIWRPKWQEWSEFIRNRPVMKWGWGSGSIEVGRDSKFKWWIGWTQQNRKWIPLICSNQKDSKRSRQQSFDDVFITSN